MNYRIFGKVLAIIGSFMAYVLLTLFFTQWVANTVGQLMGIVVFTAAMALLVSVYIGIMLSCDD